MKKGEFVEEIIITVRRTYDGGKILEARRLIIPITLDSSRAPDKFLMIEVDNARQMVDAKHKEILG